jgi:lipopolysaccharide biosynthesis protein
VVIHIYYEETWNEIAAILRASNLDFDLISTVSSGNERLVMSIRRDFPEADIHAIENRGRDVRPFLVLLEQGRLDRCYICKIHGKKSHDGGRMAVLGAIWRNRMLFDLLAAPDAASSILDMFERRPKVGMIGSAAYRYPSPLCSPELSWGENRPRVLEIASKMGIAADQFELDFFCGTMFWVRPEALRPLRELSLAETFPDELGKLDGALEHAVERLFSAAVVAAGYTIEGIDRFDPD